MSSGNNSNSNTSSIRSTSSFQSNRSNTSRSTNSTMKNSLRAAMPAVSSNGTKKVRKLTLEEKIARMEALQAEREKKAQARKDLLAAQKVETAKRREAKKEADKAAKDATKIIMSGLNISKMVMPAEPKPTVPRKKKTIEEILAEAQAAAAKAMADAQQKVAEKQATELKRAQEKEAAKAKREQEKLEKKAKSQEEKAKALASAADAAAGTVVAIAAETKTRKVRSKEERAASLERKLQRAKERADALAQKAQDVAAGVRRTKKKIAASEADQIAKTVGVTNQLKQLGDAVVNSALAAAGTKKKKTLAEKLEEARKALANAASRAHNAASNAGVSASKTKRVKKSKDEKCATIMERIMKAQKAFSEAGCSSSSA
jgi:hypothetical protein